MREETIYTQAKWWRLTRETEKPRMKSDTIQAETCARLWDAGCKAGGVDCQKHTNWVWKRQKVQRQSIRKSPFICKFTSTAIGIGIGRLITEETKWECAVNGKKGGEMKRMQPRQLQLWGESAVDLRYGKDEFLNYSGIRHPNTDR